MNLAGPGHVGQASCLSSAKTPVTGWKPVLRGFGSWERRDRPHGCSGWWGGPLPRAGAPGCLAPGGPGLLRTAPWRRALGWARRWCRRSLVRRGLGRGLLVNDLAHPIQPLVHLRFGARQGPLAQIHSVSQESASLLDAPGIGAFRQFHPFALQEPAQMLIQLGFVNCAHSLLNWPEHRTDRAAGNYEMDVDLYRPGRIRESQDMEAEPRCGSDTPPTGSQRYSRLETCGLSLLPSLRDDPVQIRVGLGWKALPSRP